MVVVGHKMRQDGKSIVVISSSPIFFIIHLVTLTMVRSGGINAVLIGHDLLQI